MERLVATLEAETIRTVVVSDGWLFVWSTPGDNAGLEDYLASTFQDTARFDTYRVLTRKLRLPHGQSSSCFRVRGERRR